MPSGNSIFLLLAALPLVAQHNYTPADVQDGANLYRSSCVSCHGPDGNLVNGIDLGQNKFKRASTDDQLIQIIRTGIPGTPMPPGNYTEFQAGTIVAYLRSLASGGRAVAANGDAARGKLVVEGKGACLTCHRIGETGSRVGPDLSDIGTLRRSADLEQSLLNPDAEQLPQNRYYRVVTKSGETVTGRIFNLDTFSIQMLDTKEQMRYFAKSNLKEHGFVAKSPMPSVQGSLTPQEIADIVAYLGTLKGSGK